MRPVRFRFCMETLPLKVGRQGAAASTTPSTSLCACAITPQRGRTRPQVCGLRHMVAAVCPVHPSGTVSRGRFVKMRAPSAAPCVPAGKTQAAQVPHEPPAL
ncbi:hypothetical protein GCM10018773_41660 [Streptomyces candidus]|nr:hypothetical protein GCM10018773_41660 [Streptomyces candidus]